jgi:hypothetical protein
MTVAKTGKSDQFRESDLLAKTSFFLVEAAWSWSSGIPTFSLINISSDNAFISQINTQTMHNT